jgi:hypothetical protein
LYNDLNLENDYLLNDIYFGIARSYYYLKDYSNALININKNTQIKSPYEIYIKAMILLKNGFLNEAKTLLEKSCLNQNSKACIALKTYF